MGPVRSQRQPVVTPATDVLDLGKRIRIGPVRVVFS
jgi:hypothetical protein